MATITLKKLTLQAFKKNLEDYLFERYKKDFIILKDRYKNLVKNTKEIKLEEKNIYPFSKYDMCNKKTNSIYWKIQIDKKRNIFRLSF